MSFYSKSFECIQTGDAQWNKIILTVKYRNSFPEQVKFGAKFKVFFRTYFGVWLINAPRGISEHSSRHGCSSLDLCCHQIFLRLHVFGAAWYTVTREWMSVDSVPHQPLSWVCLLHCRPAVLKDSFIASPVVLFSILCMFAVQYIPLSHTTRSELYFQPHFQYLES